MTSHSYFKSTGSLWTAEWAGSCAVG